MDADELARRFAYHRADTQGKVDAHQTVREFTGSLADLLNGLLPDSREKSLAMTKLEEAMFWSNACIARLGPA